MTPTLPGRLQTRLLIVLSVGLPAMIVLGVLTGMAIGRATLVALVIGALSMGWELAWHGLQQLRWDRDWPSVFALLAAVPEAIVAKLVLAAVGVLPFGREWGAYVVMVTGSSVLGWLVQQGPLRVLFPAARFEGGRLLHRRTTPVATTHLSELLEPAPVVAAAGVPAASASGSSRPPSSSSGRATATARKGSAPRPPARRPRPTGGRGSAGRRRGMVLVGAVTALAFLVFTVLDISPHNGGTPTAHPSPSRLRTASTKPQPHAQPWTAPPGQQVLDAWDTHGTVAPYAITVPTLRMQAFVEPVAMTQGSIASPTKPADVGWYSASSAPGHAGPAVLIGTTRPGPFARIGRLVRGDTVLVTRGDATSVQYVVTRVQAVRAGAFPSAAVYGRTTRPTLRLVGFASPGAHRRYTLVFATAVHLLRPENAPRTP